MILFVEGEEPLARVLCKTLFLHGYKAEYIGTGPEALSIIERRPPEILFTDLLLPGGLNGIEIAQGARIRGYDGPIVLMSGVVDVRENSLDALFARAAQMDFAERLLKPIRLNDLVCLVERLTGRPAVRQGVAEPGRPVGY